jgi:hypothetical protein
MYMPHFLNPFISSRESGLGLQVWATGAQLLFVFLTIAFLTGLRWNLNEVLICISFMVRDVEYFFNVCIGYLYFFLWKLSIHLVYPFLYWVVLSLGV